MLGMEQVFEPWDEPAPFMPGDFYRATWVGDMRTDADGDAPHNCGWLVDEKGFFVNRYGSVLVACGEKFRLGACMLGATQPPPDMQFLHGLHKALCYSPAAGCMVLDSRKSQGGLKLVQFHSNAEDGDTSVYSRWLRGRSTFPIQVPTEHQVTCCALSPDGAWLLLGCSTGEVHLATVPARSSAAATAASSRQHASVTEAAGSADNSSETGSVTAELLGSHDKLVGCCTFHPSNGYVATCW